MWAKVEAIQSPSGPLATFTSFMKLFNLKQAPSESWADYMSKVQGLDCLLRGKSAMDLIVLFAIFAADEDRYGDIATNFRRGDPNIINSDLFALEQMGESIDARNSAAASFSGKRLPSANKAAAAATGGASGGGGDRGQLVDGTPFCSTVTLWDVGIGCWAVGRRWWGGVEVVA